MDNFQIISALCRQVIKDGASNGALQQMERLYNALKESGASNEARMLRTLINKADTQKSLEPTKLELSRAAFLNKQELRPNSKVPVDKETGAPLAEIIFPESMEHACIPVMPEDLTLAVEQLLEQWSNVDKLASYGVLPLLSCLLFGLPGTGKTMLALYIARKLQLPIVLAKLDGLVSSLLGTSARNITNLFNFAAQYDCVLLLDEFDAVAKARNDQHEVGEIKRVVNTLLQCIDTRARTGMTIAITNHEVLLDPAIWRRFEMRIFVPKPTFDARKEIIIKYHSPLNLSEEEIKFLSLVSEGFSGSDIRQMLNSLKRMTAINNVELGFIGMIKSFLVIHAGAVDDNFRNLINTESDHVIMNKLYREHHFTQSEIARIFNVNQSKVSRCIKEC